MNLILTILHTAVFETNLQVPSNRNIAIERFFNDKFKYLSPFFSIPDWFGPLKMPGQLAS